MLMSPRMRSFWISGGSFSRRRKLVMVERSLPVRSATWSWRELVLVYEPGEGDRGFDRVEVFALDVLDQGEFEQAVLLDGADEGGNFGEAG